MNDVIEGLYLRESDDFMSKIHKLWVMDWHKLFHKIYDDFALKSLTTNPVTIENFRPFKFSYHSAKIIEVQRRPAKSSKIQQTIS